MNDAQPVTIVLVEDDPGHARLIEKNLRRANIKNDIVKLNDGGKALDFFFGPDDGADPTTPGSMLVLLDLNLPGVSGYDILQRLKTTEATRRVPVVVLTTTDDRREMARCYDLGCNVYVTKPVDYDRFTEAIARLGLFLTVVSVPDVDKAPARPCAAPPVGAPA
ncbi:response regulator [bacterium]|nr:response regulator [bacterium]